MKQTDAPRPTARQCLPASVPEDTTPRPVRPHLSGPDGLLAPLVVKFLTTVLEIELREHLGYDRHDAAGWGTGNSRNGVSPKIVTTDIGSLEIKVPRDRCGTFTPLLVPKRLRHLPHLGATVLLLYALGIPPRLAMERIVSLYHCAGSQPGDRLAEQVVRGTLRDVHGWRTRQLPAVDRLLVDKMQLISPAGPIALYAAVGKRATGEHDIYGLWAMAAAATTRPAPEVLVAALRRSVDAPATVHTHSSVDVVALVRRVWPRATVVADVHRRLHNPFRAEETPGPATSRTAMRRASLVAG